MIPLAAGELEGTHLLSGDPATVIEAVVSDSRAAGPGALFCALEGARSDGHDYLDDVRAAGVAAVLCRTGRSRALEGVCVLEADEPLTALGAIARQVRRAWGGKVIGIAGSNGKTSTKDMLAALCAPHVPTLATHRNHNNRLGLPLTLFRLEPGHALCICELGTSEIGELADLAAIAEPEIGVVTNIAPEHLEFLGDLEGVAREEGSLLAALAAGGDAVLPAGEPLLAPYLRDDLRTTAFGDPGGDVRCLSWEPAEGGTRAVLDVLGERCELIVPLRPTHHAANLAAATAAYMRAGLPLAGLAEGAAAIELSPLRGQELERHGGGVLINDAYNANPVSVASALTALVERAQGARTVAVLGHMAEMGPDAASWHATIGRSCASIGIDVVIGVGEPAAAYDSAAEGCEWHWAPTLEAASEMLPRVLRPGDFVLLKGSRSAAVERLAEVAL
ncbi:MAG TPA: UDP-N-acetylmuramoyl-tripeptide--D-alanyl-D-alanine ligase [Gaiellales bacterium]|nr:UDP-N-acetylmuramoyl-tripeptide--D-alanyl-D-alanine ligase [Gaiellales bacterium]